MADKSPPGAASARQDHSELRDIDIHDLKKVGTFLVQSGAAAGLDPRIATLLGTTLIGLEARLQKIEGSGKKS